MNWEAIGAVGEVGGAIAVVVTLAYLARQIRQSTQATRIAAYHQAQEQCWSVGADISTDPGMADILARTLDGGIESLAPAERVRFEMAMSSLYFGFESLTALHEKGLIDSELWQNWFENNVQVLGLPLFREYLASRPGSISRRLEARINEHLKREVNGRTHR